MVAMPGASGSCLVTSPIRVVVSHSKQSLEELPIASEGDPKVLGGGFFATVPLLFESRTCLGEANRQLLNDIRDQTVCLLDAFFGVVYEPGLDIAPTRAESRELIIGEKRSLNRCFGRRP